MYIFIDESGNFGKKDRYFVIACLVTRDGKKVWNRMKTSLLQAKKNFPDLAQLREIKASSCCPIVKDYVLRKLCNLDIEIHYVVGDKKWIEAQLISDENRLYNFLLQFLLVPLARRERNKQLIIRLDNRTIKTASINSFEDYIAIKLNYEHKFNVDLDIKYVHSHNSFSIQGADFLANALWSYYEHGYGYYYDLIKHRIQRVEKFPYSKFGADLKIIAS